MLSKYIYIPFFTLTGFNKSMNYKEAVSILDIRKKESIYDKYKHLIKLNHPDRGGSSYISSKINEAYEYLRKRNSI
jgi:DnaJ homolog subfamily C member 19